jgi:TolB protein
LFVHIARNGNEGKRDVIEMDANGNNIVWLTQSSTRSIHTGGLSPDGTKIVFDEGNPYASATTEVYIADYPTFANKLQIANPAVPGAEYAGGWNSANLIVMSVASVYTVNSDGSGLDTLTAGTDSEWGAMFSPDGNKIIFSTNPGGITSYYVMDSNGGNRTLLLAGSASVELLSYSWR